MEEKEVVDVSEPKPLLSKNNFEKFSVFYGPCFIDIDILQDFPVNL